MKIVTKATLMNAVASRYKATHCQGKNANNKAQFGMGLTHKEHYELLKDATTEEEVTKILGHSSWAENSCTECGRDCRVVVELGEEPGYESQTIWLCLECAKKAVRMLKRGIKQL